MGEVIKRDILSKHDEYLFRKLLTVLLIIVFFTQINCTQFIQQSKLEECYLVCPVKYVQGSSLIPSGRGGVLKLFAESMLFEQEDFTLEIRYQDILDIEYNKNLNAIINKFPERNNWDYIGNWEKLGRDFLIIILGIILLCIIISQITLKFSKKYTYMDITYEINDHYEWHILKIKTKEINKVLPILKGKLSLK